MRIIAGENRGRKLISPKDNNIRPTEDRVREALFNIISDRLYNSCSLDLFGGSGAITCELVSRGAREVVINELEKKHLEIIRVNLAFLTKKDRVKILNHDFRIALKKLEESYKQGFDLIFLDPPYDRGMELEALDLIDKYELLKSTGMIIVESSKKIDYESNELFVTDYRKYGRAHLTFFEKDGKNVSYLSRKF